MSYLMSYQSKHLCFSISTNGVLGTSSVVSVTDSFPSFNPSDMDMNMDNHSIDLKHG